MSDPNGRTEARNALAEWVRVKTRSRRGITPEEMQDGDIGMKLSDGTFYLVGSAGGFNPPTRWERFKTWLGR